MINRWMLLRGRILLSWPLGVFIWQIMSSQIASAQKNKHSMESAKAEIASLFKNKKWSAALALAKAADTSAKDGYWKGWQGRILEKMGKCEEAGFAYRAFLRAPGLDNKILYEKIAKSLENCEKKIQSHLTQYLKTVNMEKTYNISYFEKFPTLEFDLAILGHLRIESARGLAESPAVSSAKWCPSSRGCKTLIGVVSVVSGIALVVGIGAGFSIQKQPSFGPFSVVP